MRVNGSMGVLKMVNGGVGQGQWGHWSGSMGVLKRVNGRWSVGALVGVNGGIEKGQWGRWSGSMGASRRVRSDRGLALGQAGVWLWVRQGCGCGSDRSLSYRVVSSTLQGCKLYLTGLEALPYRVVGSTLQGCRLYLAGL